MQKTPLTVITGYLGAGKTTLLKRLLAYASANKLRLAVLMNEFGEVGIDTKIVKGKNVDVVEMAGGCVCCSMTGEFEAAIAEVIEKFAPEHIVLETTGVAEPDAIIMDVQENIPLVRLDAVVTVADADALARFPSLGHTGRVQLEMADIILLNKSDLVDAEQLEQIRETLGEINERAVVYETTNCNAPMQMLLDVNAGEKHVAVHGHEVSLVGEFVVELDGGVDEQAFTDFANSLPSQVYRAKGFVEFDDGSTRLFNYVAGRWSIEEWDEGGGTQIVFIGEGVSKVEEIVREALLRCVEE